MTTAPLVDDAANRSLWRALRPRSKRPLTRALRGLACLAMALASLPARADLESDIRALVRDAGLGESVAGVAVKDLDTDRYLVRIEADRALAPASNMKVLTTAAALGRLGPDFAFETRLERIAGPDPQTVDLILRGGGDPVFGDPTLLRRLERQINQGRAPADHVKLTADTVLDDWCNDLVEEGVGRIDTLWVDDRVFDDEFVHPDWPKDQLDFYYCAQVAGLNFYNNVISFTAAPTSPGAAPAIEAYPFGDFVTTYNLARTGRTNDLRITREPDANVFTLRGATPSRERVSASRTTHDPPMFLANLLAERLQARGVEVGAIARPTLRTNLPPSVVIERFRSTLPWVLLRVNRDSHNMAAEAVLKRLGHEMTGAPGSYQAGAAAVRRFLSEELHGRAPIHGVLVADGSGMSHRNRLTARLLVETLDHMLEDPAQADVLRASLARPGQSGTLRNRMKDDLTARLYAKTGTIGRPIDGQWISASSLSGVLELDDPQNPGQVRRVAFSILVNGFRPRFTNAPVRRLQDRIVNEIDDDLVRRASAAAAATPSAPAEATPAAGAR
ncbi:MAG: D-alanyl-D-alanine carboxypeptidase/D-alanyl-D-alanine-endopeptidase [Planctomycetota bacterium]